MVHHMCGFPHNYALRIMNYELNIAAVAYYKMRNHEYYPTDGFPHNYALRITNYELNIAAVAYHKMQNRKYTQPMDFPTIMHYAL